jgi:hypothetical protein
LLLDLLRVPISDNICNLCDEIGWSFWCTGCQSFYLLSTSKCVWKAIVCAFESWTEEAIVLYESDSDMTIVFTVSNMDSETIHEIC